MKKTLKSVLRKFLKCMIIIAVIFVIYLIICFFQSKTLITELADAIYRDDIKKIYELTEDPFYEKNNSKEDDNKTIQELLKEENYTLLLCDNGLNSFAYEIKNVKPIWQGFLYEIDITMTNYETLYLSGENINSFYENEEFYIKEMQNYAVDEDIERVYKKIANEVTKNICLDDMEHEKYGIITTSGEIIYNVFTREVSGLHDFYKLRKGLAHNMLAFTNACSKYTLMKDFGDDVDTIEFYNQSGDAYCAKFYNNVFIGIDNHYNNKNIKDWAEINKHFIENKKSEEEIIQFLSGEGYIFAEKMIFSNPEWNIEIAFYNDKYVWSSDEEIRGYFSNNDFNKDEVIRILEDYGYYLGKRLYFEKDKNRIEIFIKDEELMWLNGDDSEILIQYIVRNNLKQDEIITFLLKEGYVEIR